MHWAGKKRFILSRSSRHEKVSARPRHQGEAGLIVDIHLESIDVNLEQFIPFIGGMSVSVRTQVVSPGTHGFLTFLQLCQIALEASPGEMCRRNQDSNFFRVFN